MFGVLIPVLLTLTLMISLSFWGPDANAEAEQTVRDALALEEKEGKECFLITFDYQELALLNQAQGKYFEAERLYQRTYRLLTSSPGNNDLAIALCLQGYADLAGEMGQQAQANDLAAQAKALLKRVDQGESTPAPKPN